MKYGRVGEVDVGGSTHLLYALRTPSMPWVGFTTNPETAMLIGRSAEIDVLGPFDSWMELAAVASSDVPIGPNPPDVPTVSPAEKRRINRYGADLGRLIDKTAETS